MNAKTLGSAALLCMIVSPLLAVPTLTITPAGVQSGNWVWNVDLTPDLTLNPDTPVAVELGFRLTGGSLLSVANINPSEFDTSNPGKKIFGWETTFPEDNNNPEGIEANCISCTISNPVSGPHPSTIVPGVANEVFVAMGSIDFTTAGAKPFLKIVATGPSGGALSSTIQWLGIYGVGSNKGRIAQLTGPVTVGNFDTFAGSATQFVPEPATAILLGAMAFTLPMQRLRRRTP